MKISKPYYYDSFRCVAGACPDSCCKEWDVDVDDTSAAYYRGLPGELGDRLRQVLQDTENGIVMTIENGRCPMWREDGLCRIQAELGEEALCNVCREFPRIRHDYGDFMELGLELSCPEAAKIILSARQAPPITEEIPGGEAPEYNGEIMDMLLRSREFARRLLANRNYTPAETLSALLIYGSSMQAVLEGGLKVAPFDEDASLETAKKFGVHSDIADFLNFFKDLEILTPRWASLLDSPTPAAMGETHRALARYLVDRYWLQTLSDYDLVGRVKFIVIACLLTTILGGDPIKTAQLFSKEIENDADNVDAILDGTYTCPAFTDSKLLGMLDGK